MSEQLSGQLIHVTGTPPWLLRPVKVSSSSELYPDMIFCNNVQRNKYHQVWKEIFKIINDENGELKIHEKIRLFDSNLPIEKIIKKPSITIVIKSLIEKDNKVYLELSLNHCLYEI